MVTRTTVRLPTELLRQAKRKAAMEGTTFTSLLERGLRLALSGTGNSGGDTRAMPPVSTAKGGRNPEFAHLSFNEIEELEDIERLNRLTKKSAS